MATGDERREARAEKLRGRAARKTAEGEALWDRSGELAACADRVESGREIRSEDDDAPERLRERIAKLERQREEWKKVNAAWRKAKAPAPEDSDGVARFAELAGLSVEGAGRIARGVADAYSWEKQPIAKYQLANLGQNIARLRKRLETVKAAQSTPDSVEWYGLERLELAPSENRVRLYCGREIARGTCAELKRYGFRWAPSLGCWSAYHNTRSIEAGRRIAKALEEIGP